MAYERPQPVTRLDRRAREEMLREYFRHYGELSAHDLGALNRKIPRDAFRPLLDFVGELLVSESARMSSESGAVRSFLDDNPLPSQLEGGLPDTFRAFCLALNALKQWVVAEQAATDRYLLGGTARADCRAAADTCILSGEPLTRETTELHHPVRDGRPPIPLSKAAHGAVEGQVARASRSRSAGANEYHATRLVFKADVIERLSPGESFRIITPEGTFEMTRAEFESTFANVASSATYAKVRVYSYSQTPSKAHQYLVFDPPAI